MLRNLLKMDGCVITNDYSIKPNSIIQNQIDEIKDFAINGDYAERALISSFNAPVIRAEIVRTYLKYAKGKKGIVYTINKEHNQQVCENFIKAGIKAKAIDSDTDSKTRDLIVREFRKGDIDVLCNVNIFSEGFDCPDVEFIQLARPTKSLAMYLQQVGRGLRATDGKDSVIFLDNVGQYNRFGLPSAPRKWKQHFEGGKNHEEKKTAKNSDSELGCCKFGFIKEGNEVMELIFKNEDNKNEPSYLNYPVIRCNFDTETGMTFLDSFYKKFDRDEESEAINEIIDNTEENLCIDDISKDSRDKFEAQQNQREPFYISNAYKMVITGDKKGIYNSYQKIFTAKCVYDEIFPTDILGRAIVRIGSYYGMIDIAAHREIIRPCYQTVESIRNSKMVNFYIVKSSEKYGIIRAKTEKIIINIELRHLEYINRPITVKGNEPELFFIYSKRKYAHSKVEYGILTEDFTEKTYFHKNEEFNKFYYLSELCGWKFICQNNKLVFPIAFKRIKICKKTKNSILGYGHDKKTYIINFEEEKISLIEIGRPLREMGNNLFYTEDGFIDKNGNYLNHEKLTMYIFYNGYIIYEKESKWSIMNFNGKVLFDNYTKIENAQQVVNDKNSKIIHKVSIDAIDALGYELAEENTNFQSKDLVFHSKFGIGIIKELIFDHHNQQVNVDFGKNGTRLLIIRYANLKKIIQKKEESIPHKLSFLFPENRKK